MSSDLSHPEPTPGPGPGRDRRLAWLLLAALVLRLVLNLGLHAWPPPTPGEPKLLALSQRLMAMDAWGFQAGAQKVLEHWRHPQEGLGPEQMVSRFSVFLAGLYRLTWNDPLLMVLVNALCYLGAGLLAHGLARRLGHPPGRARWLALAVCLWPPSLAWSALPMKEGLCLLGILAYLSLLLWLAGSGPGGWGRRALAALGLLALAGLLSYLRFYLGYLLLLVGWAPLLARLLPARSGRRPAWAALGGVAVLSLAIFSLTHAWHTEYFVYFEKGELLPRTQFEAAAKHRLAEERVAAQATPTPPATPAIAAAPAPPPAAEPPASPPLEERGLWGKIQGYRERFLGAAGQSLSPTARGAWPTRLWGMV
ncbi:MAG: hypothetical protein V1806_13505, partial [Pseudomonadota bacterium]